MAACSTACAKRACTSVRATPAHSWSAYGPGSMNRRWWRTSSAMWAQYVTTPNRAAQEEGAVRRRRGQCRKGMLGTTRRVPAAGAQEKTSSSLGRGSHAAGGRTCRVPDASQDASRCHGRQQARRRVHHAAAHHVFTGGVRQAGCLGTVCLPAPLVQNKRDGLGQHCKVPECDKLRRGCLQLAEQALRARPQRRGHPAHTGAGRADASGSCTRGQLQHADARKLTAGMPRSLRDPLQCCRRPQ